MSLSSREAKEAYDFLATSLRDVGLTWVLEQVEERIAVGKTTLRKVKSKEFPGLVLPDGWEPDTIRERRAPSATFVASEEYDDLERLDILATALGLAVPTLFDVAEESLNMIPDEDRIDSILFAPEIPTLEPHEVSFDQIARHKEAALRLRSLLRELALELADGTQINSSR